MNSSKTFSVALAFVLSTLATFPSLGRADDSEYRLKLASAIRDAANRVLPSVVTIEIIGAVGGPGEGEVEQDAPTSGIIIDEEGFVLASSIVVRRPSASMLVLLPDGSRHPAKLVAKDNHRDLVLLKIKTDKELKAATFPDEFNLPIGSTTVAVGRYGNEASPLVSSGVLSATERLDGIALQTDARVSPSFYGGPLIDLQGNLIGVLIPAVLPGGAPDATSWYDSGIAFAIPSNVISRKLDRLRDGKDIDKGLIGIVPKAKDPYKNDTELAAVRVRSPAENAGLKPGDKISTVAGKKVRRFQEIRQVLGSYDAGEKIEIKFERAGKSESVEVELAKTIPPLEPQRLGIIASERTDGEDDESEQVVVQATVPGSAVDGRLETGDVILKIGQSDVKSLSSLRSQLISAAPGAELKLTVLRGKEEKEIAATPDRIAGDIITETPDAWKPGADTKWKAEELKLPDVGNEIALVGPDPKDPPEQLGMLVLLLNPGQGKPVKAMSTWTDIASKHGVVVCAIAPEADERWKPKEIETVKRIARAVTKKFSVEPTAVAVATSGALAGGKAEASDSMALAVAITASKTFFGVAISNEARPPAIRLKENDPAAALQLMLPIETKEDYPTWATALEKAGYPVVLGGKPDGDDLLSWVRLLQSL